MQTGAKIGSNTSYLPAETVASLPASYQLLLGAGFSPAHARGPAHFAGARHRRGVGATEFRFTQRPNARARPQSAAPGIYARAVGARAHHGHGGWSFAARPPPEHLKILQLVGRGRAVVDAAFYDADAGTFGFDTDRRVAGEASARALFRDGDGSVTTESARCARCPAPGGANSGDRAGRTTVCSRTRSSARELGEFLEVRARPKIAPSL